ncbi:uncharacterized protein E0L32_008743 [Thyridium curvatum]|uniref:Zn(2)-C6 fungal-type domain-containing protein n=1 Tax=Thyridium curvatum TaxID=1093900 RepID=A0A507B019_9PEZI|nr:uncharacterized protein E0L32_008743 [Thyridium curvatum]TPX10338.1 hypothetical protein E0L32_008743 [Thyridium curvatum]
MSARKIQSTPWRRKACTACTKAKRRCNKASPACRRCREMGGACVYPLTKQLSTPGDAVNDLPTNLAYDDVNALFESTESSQADVELWDSLTPAGSSVADVGILPQTSDNSSNLRAPQPLPRSDNPVWFLAPGSFSVRYSSDHAATSRLITSRVLKHTAKELSEIWPKMWVSRGETPFIHRSLYQCKMPDCIRDAYTAIATYYSRTTETEDMVARILDDRASRLIEDQVFADSFGSLGVLDHLARSQALYMYQAVRLFNGDIQNRARAEDALTVLIDWVTQMLQVATDEFGNGFQSRTSSALGEISSNNALMLSWRMWVVTESVRRTFLAAKILVGVYLTIRDGCCECAGSTYFTSRKSLWDAPSAYVWSKICQDNGPLFVELATSDILFTRARPAEIDEFCRLAMSVTFGLEAVEAWHGELAAATRPPLD